MKLLLANFTRFNWVILIAFTFISLTSSAQIDSLKQELENAPNDSVKRKLLVKLAIAYEPVDFSIAKEYYNQSIQVSIANNWFKEVGDSYFNKSFYYHYTLRSDTAFLMLSEAQKWYEKANYKEGVLSSYFTKGTYNLNMERFDSATYYLEAAVIYGDTLNDSIYLHRSYNNLGLIYHYLGFYDKGIENFIKAIHLKEKFNSRDATSAYVNIGLSYSVNSQFEESIFYYNKALNSFKNLNDQAGEALCLTNIGEVYSLYNSHNSYLDSAVFYYNQAYAIFEVLQDSNSMARSLNSTAGLLQQQQKNTNAILKYEEALKMVPSNGLKRLQVSIINDYNSLRLQLPNLQKKELQEIIKLAQKSYRLSYESGLIKQRTRSAQILFHAHTKNHQYKEANAFGKEYIELNDSLNNQSRMDALAEQQIRFETEKKEIEIELLNKENLLKSTEIEQGNELHKKQSTIINLLVAGVIAIIIFIGVIFKLYRNLRNSNIELNAKNELISTQKDEKEVLLKEIHHRVKNNLQIIWSLLDLQSNTITDKQVKLAINDGKNRVNSMAMIHQMLYQNEDAGNIYFKDYIHKLTHQIRSSFNGSEQVKIILNIPEELKFNIDTSIPLGLIITELFTNSLKYGINAVPNSIIKLELTPIENDDYLLTISDNGAGMPEGFIINKSKSLGLKLVTNLSKQLQGKVTYQLNNGAEFNITFKGKSFTIA